MAALFYFLAIAVALLVCIAISQALIYLRRRSWEDDEKTSQKKRLENKGYFWVFMRLFVEIPRAADVILIVIVLSNWGLDRAMLSHPIISSLVGLTDIVVAVESLIFACCTSPGTVYKRQAKVYCFYSLTLGFPFGTATKILLLLYAGGNEVIKETYIPVPYFTAIGMGIVTVSVIACYDYHSGRHGNCCKRFFFVLALIAGLLTLLLPLHHAHVYNFPMPFHNELWLISLFPLWIILAVAFVYTTHQFWLLVFQSCFQTSVPATERYHCRLQLLYMTPDMCLVYGYLTVALVLTSQADGYIAGGKWCSVLVIATESVSLALSLLALGVPICNLCHYKSPFMESQLGLDQGTQPSPSIDTTTRHPPEQLQYPSHWDSTGHIPNQQQTQMVPVDQSTEDAVVTLMRETWYEYEGNCSTRLALRVKQVTQLKNSPLFHRYLKYRCMMREKHQLNTTTDRVLYMDDAKVITRDPWLEQQQQMDPQINEVYLWHGISQKGVHLICSNGFDPSLTSAIGLFGKGIYFSEKSSKSTDSTDGPKYMFLTRVCIGKFYKITSHCSLETPPCVVPGCNLECSHIRHDSVIACHCDTLGNNVRHFVLYEPYSCYPDFLIEYETTLDS